MVNDDFDTDENDEDDEDELLCNWCNSVMFFSESDNCYLCPFCDMEWDE